MDYSTLPRDIFSGCWTTGHCQGIAVDTKREYIYYSFTTSLVKTDMRGNLIGTVGGLLGHLGCIAFNDDDGRLYGSLEYKNDAIGRSILNMLKSDATIEDAFYIARFDVDKIDRVGMDACADGVMKAIYLKEVVDDFTAKVTNGGKAVKHRLGCSGIDGTICSSFVVCQGNSPTQVEAIAESVGDVLREQLKEKPTHVVGLENAQWVAMDYGDVLVHIFLPDVRAYYDLEHLWEDAQLTHIPDLD